MQNCERTATVKTANYVVVGTIEKFDLFVIFDQFPDLKKDLQKYMINYHDRRKIGI